MINKKLLDNFLAHGFVSKKKYEQIFATLPREKVTDWLMRRLLATGSALFLAGAICFFAYNWKEMGLFLRLGLPLCAMFLCACGSWKFRPETSLGSACCVGTGVFAGTFMAVYGQSFQTGAFVYELFSSWALVLAVLALVSRVRWLWLMAFYVLAIFFENKYSYKTDFYTVAAWGVFSWAICEIMIFKKAWPASFRNCFVIPLFVYLVVHFFGFIGEYKNMAFWVTPLLALAGVGLALKPLKSPSLLCTCILVLAIFMSTELVMHGFPFRDLFSYGLALAFVFAGAGFAAWRGVQYIRGNK